MKKVLFVTGPMAGHGGEESVIQAVVTGLSDQYKVALLVTDMIGDTEWINPIRPYLSDVVVLEQVPRWEKAFIVANAIRRIHADIIVPLSPRMTLLSKVGTTFQHCVIASWLHFSIDDKYSEQTIKLLRFANVNMVLSESMKTQLMDQGVAADRIKVIYNPVTPANRLIAPSMMGQPTQIVYIARIQYAGQKNLQELLHACGRLKGNWQLQIYGNDDSDDLRETKQCQKLIGELGIQDHVIWNGFSDTVWQDIKTADCLALTSTVEGFGMVLCEAASYGIPLISSAVLTGPTEIITSENGMLYDSGDVSQLAKLLQGFVNGQYSFDQQKVVESIAPYYIDRYMARMKRIFSELK